VHATSGLSNLVICGLTCRLVSSCMEQRLAWKGHRCATSTNINAYVHPWIHKFVKMAVE
jgi:hypothetical protein